MAAKGITLYSVGCEPAILPYKDFFTAIAYTTGGQYIPLRNAKLLAKVIVGGAIEEISLEKLMEEVQIEVDEQRSKGVTDEHDLTCYVEQRLKSKGATTSQLTMNNSKMERASESAVKYSKMASMSEIKESYVSEPVQFNMASCFAGPAMSYAAPRMMSMSRAPIMRISSESEEVVLDRGEMDAFGKSAVFCEDVYETKVDEIQTEQVERMVQKAMSRKK